jgi:hypothetical protein
VARTAVSLAARVRSRSIALLVIALVAVALAALPAAAQTDPPPTDPPPTEPTTTAPPDTEPTTTAPPVTEPTTTSPPPTSGPPATPAPTSEPPPSATTAPGGGATTTPTARRSTPTTRRPTATTRDPADEEPPSTSDEGDPTTEATEAPGATTEATRPRERLPLLVAPTTVPEAPPAAVAVIDAAPLAGSKTVPLLVIVAIGLAGLVLVLRPGRRPSSGSATAAALDPVLLAGPSVPAPVRAAVPTPIRRSAPAADREPVLAPTTFPPSGTAASGTFPPIAPTGPTETGSSADDRADRPAAGSEPSGPAPSDLPDVLTLVTQARNAQARAGRNPSGPRRTMPDAGDEDT